MLKIIKSKIKKSSSRKSVPSDLCRFCHKNQIPVKIDYQNILRLMRHLLTNILSVASSVIYEIFHSFKKYRLCRCCPNPFN